MATLQTLPPELLNVIIEHLVIKIGIYRAVLLRTVCHSFDAAILYAICTSQVVDMEDPATPDMAKKMHLRLRGKIILKKSKHLSAESKGYVRAVAQVNLALDNFLGETDDDMLEERHRAIAEASYLCPTVPVTRSEQRQNLLSSTAIIGNLSLLKSLLERDQSVDINGRTPYFPSALTSAARNGKLDIVQYLLDHGARPDVESGYWNETPFQKDDLSLWDDQYNKVETDQLEARNHLRLSPLRAAVSSGHTEVVHVLLKPHPHSLPTNSLEYLRTLLAAVRVGRYDFVQPLFKACKFLTFERFGKEMLWEAVRGNQKDIVERLLDLGVDVNSLPACRAGYEPRVRGALSIAASLGNITMVQYLIDRGADVKLSFCNDEWCLPIVFGASRGQKEILKFLLEHDANPELRIKEQWTLPEIALHAAAYGLPTAHCGILVGSVSRAVSFGHPERGS